MVLELLSLLSLPVPAHGHQVRTHSSISRCPLIQLIRSSTESAHYRRSSRKPYCTRSASHGGVLARGKTMRLYCYKRGDYVREYYNWPGLLKFNPASQALGLHSYNLRLETLEMSRIGVRPLQRRGSNLSTWPCSKVERMREGIQAAHGELLAV